MLDAFIMRGGPHDGFTIHPSSDQPHRDTLFEISFDDGAAYARNGRVERDAGGALREVFEFDASDATGKTRAQTDTYHGRFARLVPDEQVVEVLEFETADPELVGEMTITTTLADADGGTDVSIAYEGLPRGVSAADNEIGTRMALANLAELAETPE
jgi:hypothetical protein